ncbi:diaminopimelate epimerase [Nocardioides sp. AE5]|uniref:diaminopimelate epimerase n=1 Tax=Nocardioides sp. AE5 TaxID=2962573 RepID=UPI00288201BA|nr:diaminopimelate epimerase [Nocardioides sp. AE5]MDT0203732.1 diaminopimelate epimerase [Nocardioides sp. AE5]
MGGVSEYDFVKGHGTENDFILVPDASGKIELSPAQVVRLCDRRAGIGADGVIRVVRTDATDDPAAVAARGEARWFMDYRNADGSVSEMCGNGVRVLALYLATHSTIDPREPLKVATRAGIKTVTFSVDDEIEGGIAITVDMGEPSFGPESKVGVGERTWAAVNVDMGNPHAVAFVDDLAEAGDLLTEPAYDAEVYPHGVNIEFVTRQGDHHVAMRVHERGSGETRSCGTGACAVMAATALADGAERGTPYVVDVPGGRLRIEWTDDNRILMTGPARIVAEGTTTL